MRVAMALLLMVGGCSSAAPDIVVNETDPAITDALSDPIMADPRLALQQGGGSVSVPTGIDGGTHAQTLGQIAADRVRDSAFKACKPAIDYAFGWMARLPAELGLPGGATVSEAAGSDAKGCNLRIVRYRMARPASEVDAFYRKKGFVISGNGSTISGVRAGDGAAYWVSITETGSGASVDFVSNRGT
jgi:hypothetical protein